MDRRLILERAAAADAALNRHDAHGYVAHMAADVIWRDVTLPMPMHGPDAVRAFVERWMHALPDLQQAVTSVTFQDPRLVWEWTVTGTHLGELFGVPATRRAIRTYGATIATFDDDGLLIEATSYWNPLTTMHQLGVFPDREPVVAAASASPVATAIRPPVRTSVM